jgi:hypothetical protein
MRYYGNYRAAALGGILDLFGNLVGAAASAVAPKFTTVSGVCKPTDSPTLELFKTLQRQLNRVATIKKIQTIGVDGDIGTGTVQMMQAVQLAAKSDLKQGKLTGAGMNAATALALAPTSSCSNIAGASTGIAANVKTYADALGVSGSVASPAPAKPPAVFDPIKGVPAPQSAAASAMDAFKNMSTGAQALTVGVVGVAGYLALVPPKKRRK